MRSTNRHKTITRGFPVYTCRLCEKRTRAADIDEEEAFWCELCVDCYEECNMENAHYDGDHEEAIDPDCRHCNTDGLPSIMNT